MIKKYDMINIRRAFDRWLSRAYGIGLSDDQWGKIDAMITYACEEDKCNSCLYSVNNQKPSRYCNKKFKFIEKTMTECLLWKCKTCYRNNNPH